MVKKRILTNKRGLNRKTYNKNIELVLG